MESYRRGMSESDESGKRETMQFEDPHDEDCDRHNVRLLKNRLKRAV